MRAKNNNCSCNEVKIGLVSVIQFTVYILNVFGVCVCVCVRERERDFTS